VGELSEEDVQVLHTLLDVPKGTSEITVPQFREMFEIRYYNPQLKRDRQVDQIELISKYNHWIIVEYCQCCE
jgi:hypothetical protein